MTEEEARACIVRINEHGEALFYEVKELHDREGWKALNYLTFRACAMAEFRFSQRRIYELLNAAEVSENFAEIPQKPTSEGQLNELAKLRLEGSHDYDVEAQLAVWQIATATAPVSEQGRPLVTAAHIKSVTQVLKDIISAGAMDDGTGVMKPLGTLIDAAVTEETYERLMRQKEHIKRSREFRQAEKADRLSPRLAGLSPNIADRYKLIHCDIKSARRKIDAGSVDVIITDPPYPLEYVPLYEDLAKLAARALKPGGSMLVMIGQSYLPDILALMTPHIRYNWTVAYLSRGGQSAQLWQRKVNTFWKPVLWFVNGDEYTGDWIGDVTKSATNDNDKRFHEWGQSESGMADLIERFSYPGDTVLDPFLGGGTTGLVALKLDRLFIGIDSDKEAIETTQKRLAA